MVGNRRPKGQFVFRQRDMNIQYESVKTWLTLDMVVG